MTIEMTWIYPFNMDLSIVKIYVYIYQRISDLVIHRPMVAHLFGLHLSPGEARLRKLRNAPGSKAKIVLDQRQDFH